MSLHGLRRMLMAKLAHKYHHGDAGHMVCGHKGRPDVGTGVTTVAVEI